VTTVTSVTKKDNFYSTKKDLSHMSHMSHIKRE